MAERAGTAVPTIETCLDPINEFQICCQLYGVLREIASKHRPEELSELNSRLIHLNNRISRIVPPNSIFGSELKRLAANVDAMRAVIPPSIRYSNPNIVINPPRLLLQPNQDVGENSLSASMSSMRIGETNSSSDETESNIQKSNKISNKFPNKNSEFSPVPGPSWRTTIATDSDSNENNNIPRRAEKNVRFVESQNARQKETSKSSSYKSISERDSQFRRQSDNREEDSVQADKRRQEFLLDMRKGFTDYESEEDAYSNFSAIPKPTHSTPSRANIRSDQRYSYNEEQVYNRKNQNDRNVSLGRQDQNNHYREQDDYYGDYDRRRNFIDINRRQNRQDDEFDRHGRYGNYFDHDRRDRYPCRQQNRQVPIHQWKVSFSGDGVGFNFNEFLNRLRILQRSERIDDEDMLYGIIHLLTGRAEMWYHNNYNSFNSFRELVQAMQDEFLPLHFDFAQLSHIENRFQQSSESLGAYVTVMQSLFKTLKRRPSEEHQLYIIQRNMLPRYAHSIAIANVRSYEELGNISKRLESVSVNRQQNSRQQIPISDNQRAFRRHSFPALYSLDCEPDDFQDYSHINYNRRELSNHDPHRHSFHPITDRQESHEQYLNYLPQNPSREINLVNRSFRDASQEICWNCRHPGHSWKYCTKRREGIFCYRCGTKDVVFGKCPRCSENCQASSRASGLPRSS